MAMVINSNIMSLNAQRNLMVSQGDQNQAMERLSSGKRINSAGDDAAGLAISNRMTSQVRGLNQAIRNANDGISLIQTAEGALDETTNILQRMRELSIQSANGTYDDGNRATLNAEVQQLVSEIDRISETTKFNGLQILDGTLGQVDLQAGADAYETIALEIGSMDSRTLGSTSGTGDLMGADMTASTVAIADGDILINGKSIGAVAYDANTPTASDNVNELLDAINGSIEGVTASVYAEVVATTEGDGILTGTETFQIALTNTDGTVQTLNVSDTSSLDQLVEKINDQANGLVTASLTDDGYLALSGEVAKIDVTDGAAAGGTGIDTETEARLVLSSDDGSGITVTGNAADLASIGFNEIGAAGTLESTGITNAVNDLNLGTALNTGELVINDVTVDTNGVDDLNELIDNINAVQDETGVSASVFTTVDFDVSGATDGAVTVNGVSVSLDSADAQGTVDNFNAETAETGVTATLLADGVTISLTANSTIDVDNSGAGDTTLSDGIQVAGYKLTSSDGSPISVDQTGGNTGLLDTNVTAAGSFGSSVSDIDISTADGAQKAIGIIDNALEEINSTRGDLGAINNRLDFTINNLSNVSENVAAARSRIEDADFAAESAALSRAQVLQQAGTAMLAQANAAPQQVLSLLQ